jgi:hypothetical protein
MADQHHDEPDVPGLPQIQDEAADTPMWLPATGLGLLVLMVLMLVYHVAQGPETAAEGDVAAEGAEAEGAEGEARGPLPRVPRMLPPGRPRASRRRPRRPRPLNN